MTSSTRTKRLRNFALVAATVLAFGVGIPAAADAATPTSHPASPKPTIVLVHGAWADSSSFVLVTAKLQQDGYTVLSAPNPLRGLASDAANVAAFVKQATTGPVVLVGHSYGGAVITNAGLSTPTAKALVYIDAYAPAAGESVLDVTAAQPGSALGVPDPSTVFNFVSYAGATGGDLDTYIKPNLFPGFFAAKLPSVVTAGLAASQSPVTLNALKEKSGVPAWASIPSYFFIGTDDKILPPAEQAAMAARAGGVVVKAKADHLSMLEDPSAIVQLIEKASK